MIAGGFDVSQAAVYVVAPLVAGELDHAAVRSERAAEDRQAAGRFQRSLDREDDPLARGLDGRSGDLGDRPAVDRRPVAAKMAALQHLAEDETEATRVVELGGGVAAARLHVGDDRGPVGDPVELVDLERDPELVGEREEVEDAVRRAAGRRDRRDRVLEGALIDEVLRAAVGADSQALSFLARRA